MIELRWVERIVLVSGDIGERVKVLQYRERIGTIHEGWWSDWKDVPTVKED